MRTPTWDRAVLEAKQICAAVRRRECHAYQFADGFDNYNTASEMYTVNQTAPTYSSTYARLAAPSGLPGQGIKFSGAAGASITRNLNSNQSTLIIKVAVNFPSFPGGTNWFLTMLDNGVDQCSLAVTSSGALEVIGLSYGVQATTSPGTLAPNTWYGIECLVTIANGAGVAQVWVNGTQVINASGIYTQRSSDGWANQVALGDINGNGMAPLFDDFRIWDNTGTYQNAPMGTDSRIFTKLPASAGAFAQWTPNGAASNYSCVNDNPPDGDTTYVSGATALLQDSYTMPPAYLTLAPTMVVARSYVRKDDSNTRTMAIGVLSSGATLVGGTITLGSTYAFVDSCIPLDPHTSAVWTAAGADAAQHYKQEGS